MSRRNFWNIRFDVNVNPASDVANNEHLINKYPFTPGVSINDFKAARISEVYLMRAEARARNNSFATAASDIKAIRDARTGSSTNLDMYSSLSDAITAIKEERRLELAFEGHRYIDSKRYRNIVGEGIVRADIDCPGATPCVLPVSSEKFVFPIPTVEINGNPNIQQNPGYNN